MGSACRPAQKQLENHVRAFNVKFMRVCKEIIIGEYIYGASTNLAM